MKYQLKFSIIVSILSALSWCFLIIYDLFLYSYLPFIIYQICLILGAVSLITGVFSWIIFLIRIILHNKKKKDISPFKTFAIMDIILAIIILCHAIYDINTDRGFMAGIFGWVELIYGIPIILSLLVVDYIVYIIFKKNKKE